jgi:predicted anti-sigma-YlaC factor YlaD
MKTFAQHHLTADELDALHGGGELPRVASHLATCDDCRVMVDLDLRLVAMLSALPEFTPSSGFVPQVMARIEPGFARQQVLVNGTETLRARSARRRVLIGGALTGSLVTAGFVWAFANPTAAASFALPPIQEVGNTLWLSLQGIVANTVEQPWFGSLRDAVATPVRALPLLVAAAGAYTVALLGLRRLLTRPATDAGW